MASCRSCRFLVFSNGSFLFFLWILSSFVREKGWIVFLSGLLLLASATALFLNGKKRFLFAAYLAILTPMTAGLVIEAALHVAPGLLRGQAANWAYSAYHTHAGGIYRPDPFLGFALKENHRQWAYYNGHWWWHETNSDGYRGSAVDRADAVFLGDSMIYGHGIDNECTVPSRYAERCCLTSANLGQQGFGAVQELAVLLRHGPRLRPKTVFVCCHPNDLVDSIIWYPQSELKSLLQSPVSCPYQPRAKANAGGWSRMWEDHFACPLRTSGLLAGLWSDLRQGRLGARWRSQQKSQEDKRFVPDPQYVASPFAPAENPDLRFQWQVHCHALKAMQVWCREHEAKLVVFDLGYPLAFAHALEAWCQKQGIDYCPAGRRILRRVERGEELYLRNDGHWNTAGCVAVAEELARHTTPPPGESAR
ncbi:MAG: hypothetical protein KatS3mg105_1869 [Gemmatales bacterium]|nr:MAG: hypothetical protein KatS3mg105_1869 [Gemmatales bacterium]